MINPTTIDLSALPSVPLSERSQLPFVSCVYFAIDSQNKVQYIGATINLNQRWVQHHRSSQLFKMESVRVSYLPVDTGSLLEVEKALIQWFKPSLNGSEVQFDLTDKPKVSVYLEPDLKEKAEKAAKEDGRSLSNWIRELIRREVEND